MSLLYGKLNKELKLLGSVQAQLCTHVNMFICKPLDLYPRYIPNTAPERTCCPTQAIIWETLMLEPLDPAMTMFLKELKWFKLSRAVRPVFPRASFRTLFTCKVIKIMSIHYVYKIHVYLWSYQKQNRN